MFERIHARLERIARIAVWIGGAAPPAKRCLRRQTAGTPGPPCERDERRDRPDMTAPHKSGT